MTWNLSEEMIGRQFGSYTVIERHSKPSTPGSVVWLCKCKCGRTSKLTRSTFIKNPNIACIKCTGKQNQIHPIHGVKSLTYKSWESMRYRCRNKNTKVSGRYADRGIEVCERWDSNYLAFLEDMGPRPDKCTIERKNNNGNYEPENCIWATAKEQANNRSTNNKLTYNKETLSITEWGKKLNINHQTLSERFKRNWTVEEILTTPTRRNNHG